MRNLFHWWHRWKVYSASDRLVVLRCRCREEVRFARLHGCWYDVDNMRQATWAQDTMLDGALLAMRAKVAAGLSHAVPEGVDDRLSSKS